MGPGLLFWIVAAVVAVLVAVGWWREAYEVRHQKSESWGDLIVAFGGWLMVANLVFLGSGWLVDVIGRAECNRIGVQVERNTEWHLFGGCFVELSDGRSVPVDENALGLFLDQLGDN